MKTGLIKFLARLWRFMTWIWSTIILSLLLAVIGNVLYSIFTTGGQNFPDWQHIVLFAFLLSHWYLVIIPFLALLLLTHYAYLAHHHQRGEIDKQHLHREKMREEALIAATQGTYHVLKELKSKAISEQSPLSSIPFSAASSTSSDTWPLVWNVPYRRNVFFTGREGLLKSLREHLTGTKAVALTQTLAIHGLGGIGKTQTAVEYAYRYRQEYQAVLWVRAAARDTLISDYESIVNLLHLIEKDEQDQTRIVEALKQWFSRQKDWLLILDNADDLEILPDFLPGGEKGHLLLTTRDPAVEGMARSVEVEQMDMQEGIDLLLRRARGLASETLLEQTSQEDRVIAEQVVKEMGGLPLALDQAGAYIEQTRCGLARYLEMYQQRRADLLKWRRRVPSDYPKTVATTWTLAFESVEQLHPAAAELLRWCAFLDPDSIPEDLFVEGASELGPILQSVVKDAFAFNETIDVLRSFAFIRRLGDTNGLTMHRLVQLVLKDRLDSPTQHQWAERTVRFVNAAFPVVKFETWKQCKRYLPQVFACFDQMTLHGIQTEEASSLLHRAGWYLNEHARNNEAEPLYLRALAIYEKTRGPEHPSTSTILNNLAILYKDQGRYREAEPLYERALAIDEKTLGPEHPDTSATLHNLAQLYYFQRRYQEAEPLYERALAIYEKTRGPEHPDTSTALHSLAYLYQSQGRYQEAEPLYERALAIYEKTLGPEHPDTSRTRDNLAQLYYLQGRYQEAEPLYLNALATKERTLGPEHPSTSITLNNLAILYKDEGRYREAEPLYLRALAIYEKTRGPEHPRTAIALENYASFLQQTNRQEEAAQLYARARAIRAKQ
jgi:tetratricopeptide (TPR) repeat protein